MSSKMVPLQEGKHYKLGWSWIQNAALNLLCIFGWEFRQSYANVAN